MSKVTKALIPVAGYGTRFLPATKAQPKEMLTIIDKPVVQYLVEEAVDAGIETIIFVINSNKHIIADHFSRNLELERFLRTRKKHALLEKIQNLHKRAEFLYVHQDEPLGSADAIMRGKGLVGDEPFALFYADDLFVTPHKKPAIGQLIKAYERTGETVIGLMRVSHRESKLYGMIAGENVEDRLWRVRDIIEKPDPEKTPSTLASGARFIITPEVFRYIPKVKKKGGELYFTDALAMLAQKEEVYGWELEGTWYDCGSKIGFFKAVVELGVAHSEIGRDAKRFLKTLQ